MNKNRAAKDALFESFAEIGKALSNGHRNEIIHVLSNGERSVESLANQIEQSLANTSQHLQVLKRAGLVSKRREGTHIFYSLASTEVASFWRSLQAIAREGHSEVDRLLERYVGPLDTEAVTKEELWERLQQGAQIVVLDVRPEDEFRAGHIPKARSIPFAELEARMDELPKTTEIVAYCRGLVCAMAPQAARLLRSNGFTVKRLEEGIPEWRDAGLPVEAA